MIAALQSELIIQTTYLKHHKIETIYFGGGTPSLLSSTELEAILKTIHENYSLIESPEITLEANPDDINLESLLEWRKIGINRLSIGLQSFRAKDLEWMNRAHTREEALNCVSLAKQTGFDNINVDLIYGLPELSLTEWKDAIQKVIDLGIQHVSAYCLTVEEKTVLNKWVQEHKIIPANEDQQSEQFEVLIEELEKAGIVQYEISNFSVQNKHSRHNSNYWKGEHYVGIGPSAHSFNGKSRSWNISNNTAYIQKIEEGKEWFETEILSTKDQFNELLLIGLRTTNGVSLPQLESIQKPSESFWKKTEQMTEYGWLIQNENSIYLTKSGKLKADYIASELFMD